jgi:hypothetical protein
MRHAKLLGTRFRQTQAGPKGRSHRWAAGEPRGRVRSGDESERHAFTAAVLLSAAAVGFLVLALIGLGRVAPARGSYTWALDAPPPCGPTELVPRAAPEGDVGVARLGPVLTC